MSRSGLQRFGVEPKTVVRSPASDGQDNVVCPEDGKPVGGTRGTQRVAHPSIVDEDLDLGTEILTHGYCCDRHSARVVLPVRPEILPDGWIGVEVELADGRVREIPVPAAEVDDGE